MLDDTIDSPIDVAYWRDPKGREVDFVLSRGKEVVAIEVKTGHTKTALSGLDAFADVARRARRRLAARVSRDARRELVSAAAARVAIALVGVEHLNLSRMQVEECASP
ncbi:MAG: DUF4143 domain-containing protein [Planctomycetes bacterium]|nr:DUF4143 domain-containing protein [Planctomycetota bacterium]